MKNEHPRISAELIVPWLIPLTVALAVAVLYWHTLAPGTVYLQDVAEFQTKLHTLTVVHSTGYPFYQMVGKLWTLLLPLGSIAWRVNLLSAFFSVVTLVAMCGILQHIAVRPWAILAACGLLACSHSFWTYSILASTYTMHVALVALAVLTLLWWQAGRSSEVWFALVCGVGLAHHRVFVITLPAFAVAILVDGHTRLRLKSRWLPLSALLILPSLISYVWLATRGVWPLGRLVHYLFFEGAGYLRHVYHPAAWARRLSGRILPWTAEAFGLVPTLAALVGLLGTLRPAGKGMERRVGIVLLALGAVTLSFFSLAWISPDDRRYFLQLDLVVAAGWGLAFHGAWQLIRRLPHRWLARGVEVALALTALAPLLWLVPANLERTAPYRDGYADRVSRQILATVETESTVIGGWVLGWPLRYHQTVENLRLDVQVIVEPGGDQYRDVAIELIEAGSPVYFRERLYGLDREESDYFWASLDIGNLARALPSMPAVTQAATTTQMMADADVALRRFGLSPWPLRPDTFARLELVWDDPGGVAPDVGVRLDLKDATGATHWRYEAPWSQAVEANLHTDVYWVTPPTLQPGDHAFHVVLVSATGTALGQVSIGPVPVAVGDPLGPERLVLVNRIQPPEPIPGEDPDLRLVGYDFLESELWAGHHQVPLSVYWKVVKDPANSYEVTFVLDGGTSESVVSDSCPISVPGAGALVRTPCVLQVPSALAAGRYRLALVVDGGRESRNIVLEDVRVRSRPRTYTPPDVQFPMSVRLGDRITLVGYDLSGQPARPGHDLTATLYWRAEADGQDWLKVFTHLIAPDGTLLAQHDSAPDVGAAPTSEWVAGEVIADQHTIAVPIDATAGAYTLTVGMYAPDTGQRLEAAEADGQRYPDGAVPLRTITVEAE